MKAKIGEFSKIYLLNPLTSRFLQYPLTYIWFHFIFPAFHVPLSGNTDIPSKPSIVRDISVLKRGMAEKLIG